MKGYIKLFKGNLQGLGHGLEHPEICLVRNKPAYILNGNIVKLDGLLYGFNNSILNPS